MILGDTPISNHSKEEGRKVRVDRIMARVRRKHQAEKHDAVYVRGTYLPGTGTSKVPGVTKKILRIKQV